MFLNSQLYELPIQLLHIAQQGVDIGGGVGDKIGIRRNKYRLLWIWNIFRPIYKGPIYFYCLLASKTIRAMLESALT